MKTLKKILFYFVLLLALGTGLWFGAKKFFQIQTQRLYATVSKTLEETQEFCLYKFNYTDIVTIKKKAAGGLAKSYSIVKYTGVIRAGIKNANDITFTISEDRKSIRVTIPPTELLSNDIQSQKIFDESQNIFIPIRTQEIFDQIELAKEEAAKEILAEGLLDDADMRAKNYVKHLMTALGFENIEVL